MDYGQVNLNRISNEELIDLYLNDTLVGFAKKEKNELSKTIENSVLEAKYLLARNSIVIGLFYDTDKTIEVIKRKGIFRYSNYILKKCIVKDLSIDVLKVLKSVNFVDEDVEKYLQSVIDFSFSLQSLKDIRLSIVKSINLFYRQKPYCSLLKTLIVYTDNLFFNSYYPEEINDLSSIKSRSIEEIASAVSFLIFEISKVKGLKKSDVGIVDDTFINSSEIDNLIVNACYFLDIREFEIQIESFQYTIQLFENKAKLIPPSIGIDKSIRLGYIRSEIQAMNSLFSDEEAGSLADLITVVSESSELNFYEYTTENNYPRFRIKIPEPTFDAIIQYFIKPDTLFREEMIYLSYVFKEQLLNIDDIEKKELRDGFTLLDFIKIKRIFDLLYFILRKSIESEKTDQATIFRSLVPILSEESFYEYFEKLVPREKIDIFLDIACWYQDSEILFDLQSHPLINIEGYFLLPLSIISNSNTIRNIYASEYKRGNKKLLSDGSIDPIVEELSITFDEKSIQNCKQIEYSILGSKGEIDLFAIIDDTLFVFECKHSLHPTSIFELRTTFDYINKAESQLDKIREHFVNGKLLPELETKTGMSLSNVKSINLSIVQSNRLFIGNVFKYPVRNIQELTNFIDTGVIRTEDGNFSMWKTGSFSCNELCNYLSPENEVFSILYNSLSPKLMNYETTKPAIEYETYYLDVEKLKSMLKTYTSEQRKVS